jgi:hypothetical protein
MKNYFILLAIGAVFNVLSLGKLIRIVTLRILYPKATIEQIESFEKNTKRNYNNLIRKNKKEID